MIGTTLSHYKIIAKLGKGGMGEVFVAEDAELRRKVALKVLPKELAANSERLDRFKREARAVAALNHPNIVTIYSVEEDNGVHFLTMELVAGEPLSSRLAAGSLPYEKSVAIALSLAKALAAAHAQGIVHRDLKPANIMLGADDGIKVLDFGLAKLMPAAAVAEDSTGLPTLTMTQPGLVMGTAPYMSPEQVRGEEVDPRSDLFSFGTVLYEMLTGRRAFQGDTAAETMAAVLRADPPSLSGPDASIPSLLAKIVDRCLAKRTSDRFQSASDLAFQLESLADTGLTASPELVTTNERASRGLQRSPLAVLSLLAMLLAVVAVSVFATRFWIEKPSASTPGGMHQQRLTEIAGIEETPAISPDGKVLAFVSRVNGKKQVFLRLLAKGSPEQITHKEVDHSSPRWADENTLIYLAHPEEEGGPVSLWEQAYLGSPSPRLLMESIQGDADVSHSGRTLATFRTDEKGAALVLTERGGEKAETMIRLPATAIEGLGVSDDTEFKYRSPRWSPDDRYIAFQVLISYLTSSEIRVIDVAGGGVETIVRKAQTRGIAWLPDGSGLVYSSSQGSTLAYPPLFHLRTVKMDGSHDVRLLPGGAGNVSYVEPDVTQAGKLVASRARLEADIFRYPVDGTPLENVRHAQRVTRQTGLVQVPSASPDDEEVVYLSDSGGHSNLWVARVDGSQPARQITDEQDALVTVGIPLWSPRGDQIVYWRGRVGGEPELRLVHPNGTGQRLLVRAGGGAHWSHDGEWIYYIASSGVNSNIPSTHKIRVDGGEPVPVRCGAMGLRVASDGITGYFMPSDSRLGEVWKVAPLEEGTPELLVSYLRSRIPLWPHGHAISPDDHWLAVPLRDDGTTNLWLISTDDGSLRKITDFEQRSTTIGRQVSWSSDSKYIFAALMETDADIVLLDGALR